MLIFSGRVELSHEEFEVLWKVEHSWEDNPYQASYFSSDSVKKFTSIFLKLEEHLLLKIHIVDNKIQDATVTEQGLETLKNPAYHEWVKELKEV